MKPLFLGLTPTPPPAEPPSRRSAGTVRHKPDQPSSADFLRGSAKAIRRNYAPYFESQCSASYRCISVAANEMHFVISAPERWSMQQPTVTPFHPHSSSASRSPGRSPGTIRYRTQLLLPTTPSPNTRTFSIHTQRTPAWCFLFTTTSSSPTDARDGGGPSADELMRIRTATRVNNTEPQEQGRTETANMQNQINTVAPSKYYNVLRAKRIDTVTRTPDGKGMLAGTR